MKTFVDKAKADNALMKALNVNEIRHYILSTDKGDLVLKLRKGGTDADYHFYLDAVPVDSSVETPVEKDLFVLFKDKILNNE